MKSLKHNEKIYGYHLNNVLFKNQIFKTFNILIGFQDLTNVVDIIEYKSQFQKLEDSIQDLIKRKENIRIQTHGK